MSESRCPAHLSKQWLALRSPEQTSTMFWLKTMCVSNWSAIAVGCHRSATCGSMCELRPPGKLTQHSINNRTTIFALPGPCVLPFSGSVHVYKNTLGPLSKEGRKVGHPGFQVNPGPLSPKALALSRRRSASKEGSLAVAELTAWRAYGVGFRFCSPPKP